ncbi:hypothetical protein CHH92_13270 [Bacillus sonorensis]|nr:hypothetical protein [Bacillus sonorensis]PAD59343.1 hypothetical protein CHH92_13270 [Bacillus sonorensis]RHJ10217.1 hypothetical protein DW143_13345 [Bacillus sonorensis]
MSCVILFTKLLTPQFPKEKRWAKKILGIEPRQESGWLSLIIPMTQKLMSHNSMILNFQEKVNNYEYSKIILLF